jgi:hypothetical protein
VTILVERPWRNVKYEDVYLKQNESVVDLGNGLSQYSGFIMAQSVILKLSVGRLDKGVSLLQ